MRTKNTDNVFSALNSTGTVKMTIFVTLLMYVDG